MDSRQVFIANFGSWDECKMAGQAAVVQCKSGTAVTITDAHVGVHALSAKIRNDPTRTVSMACFGAKPVPAKTIMRRLYCSAESPHYVLDGLSHHRCPWQGVAFVAVDNLDCSLSVRDLSKELNTGDHVHAMYRDDSQQSQIQVNDLLEDWFEYEGHFHTMRWHLSRVICSDPLREYLSFICLRLAYANLRKHKTDFDPESLIKCLQIDRQFLKLTKAAITSRDMLNNQLTQFMELFYSSLGVERCKVETNHKRARKR